MVLSNNLSIIQGFCAFEIDIKDTQNSKIAKFKIHVKERVMKSNKEMKDISHYIECKAWGKLAENLNKHVSKGDYIHVLGKTVVDQWEKDGQKQRKQVVEISDFKNISKLIRHVEGGSTPEQDNNQSYGGMDTTPFADTPSFVDAPTSNPKEDEFLEGLL